MKAPRADDLLLAPPRRPRAAAVLALALLAACSSKPASGSDAGCTSGCQAGLVCQSDRCVPQQCASTSDCPAGLACLAGFCAGVGCDPPCPLDQACLGGVCIPKQPAKCQASSDCAGAETCVGGFCTSTGCAPSCDTSSICVSGVCLPENGGSPCIPPYSACTGATGAGASYCANLAKDSLNCGACDTACPTGQLCNGQGVCATSCLAVELTCSSDAGTLCIDPQTDNQSCGACGVACPAAEACVDGACASACGGNQKLCGQAPGLYCSDLQNDPFNCGACGQTCGPGRYCMGGGCFGGAGTTSGGSTASTTSAGTTTTTTTTTSTTATASASTTGTTSSSTTSTSSSTSATSTTTTGTGTIGTSTSTSTSTSVASTTATSTTTTSSSTSTGTTTTTTTTTTAGTTGGSSGTSGTTSGSTGGSTGTIPAPSVTVITVAGNGAASWADGTVGADGGAEFDFPIGLAVDPAGNIYVGDDADDRIRKIDTFGFVTTLAGNGNAAWVDGTGGASGTASFSNPHGVALDVAGNLYVADEFNQRIRKIDTFGNVTTFAGNGVATWADGTGGPSGTASFSDPLGVAVDAFGNVYVADTGNARIRVIDDGGNVTTLAGNGGVGANDGTGGPSGTATFSEPQALALDPLGNVYVADTANQLIRVVDEGRNVTTLVPIEDPTGIAVDGRGVVYVANSVACQVSRIDPGPLVTVIAGNGTCSWADGTPGPSGTAEFDYPRNVTVDATGDVFVADSLNNRIREILPYGTAWVQGASVAQGSQIAFTAPVLIGDLLVVGFLFLTAQVPAGSPTDTLGNTWTSSGGCVTNTTSGTCLELWYTLAGELQGPDAVVAPGGATFLAASALELTWGGGPGRVVPLQSNQSITATAGPNNLTCGDASALATGDLLIGYFTSLTGPLSAGAGFSAGTADGGAALLEYLVTQPPDAGFQALATDGFGAGDPYAGVCIAFTPSLHPAY